MYKIIGADQKEYGPVSADQIRQWIRDGRVNAHTQARLEPGGNWQPLSAFPEFADVLQPGVAARGPAAPAFISPIGGGGASHEAALQAIKGPAICLIVMASLGILWYLFNTAIILIGGGPPVPPNATPMMRSFYQGMHGPLATAFSFVIMFLNGFVLFGAIKMLRLQSHALAVATCILAMLPVTVGCCCLLGLPFGIWGLVVINKPEVRSQFT
jgi:hypothetical protein